MIFNKYEDMSFAQSKVMQLHQRVFLRVIKENTLEIYDNLLRQYFEF